MRNTLSTSSALFLTMVAAAAPSNAQQPPSAKPAGQPAMAAPPPAAPAPAAAPAAPPAPAGMDAKKAAAMQKMMAAWQAFATPGPEHQQLKAMTGTWSAAVKMWEDPKAPPQESTGTATAKMILEDHYQLIEFAGTMMGKPFSGWNITGYDNGRKKWLTLWVDSMGTGFYTGEGTADKTGKVVTYATQGTDPMTGKVSKGRHVVRMESDGAMNVEMFEKKGGKETKMMEIAYKKK